MAIYHFQAQVIKRSAGKSAVAASAYRAGEKIVNERTGDVHNYNNKKGIAYSEIFTPANAPDWAKNRSSLWNAVESKEKRIDSQLAKEVMVALPAELSLEQNKDLVKDFVQQAFVGKGMIADVNIHNDNPQNPHAHIMLTMRSIDEKGFGLKQRDWNNHKNLFGQRKLWEKLGNTHLAIAGKEPNMCSHSLKSQGLDKEPQIHLGQSVTSMIDKGTIEDNEKINTYFEIIERNGDKIIENPEIALKQLEQKSAIFSEYEMAKYANENSISVEQYNKVLSSIKSSSYLVSLGEDDRKKPCFTTLGTLKTEKSMLSNAYELSHKYGHVVDKDTIPAAIKGFEEANGFKLGEDQVKAIKSVVSDGDLKLIVGYAGTGKSTIMEVANDIWKKAGYEVRGCALSGKAAEGLEDGSGIKSETIDRLLLKIDNGKDGLNEKSILVVDEAGMADTGRIERLMSHMNKVNGKVVFIGDEQQLQAIEKGGAFKGLIEKFQPSILHNVIRQNDKSSPARTKIMRQASLHLATNKTGEALKAYDQLGSVKFHSNADECIKQLVSNYIEDRNNNPKISQIALAFTRNEVKKINNHIRDYRIRSSEINKGDGFKVGRGERNFSPGDRIYFLANNNELDVKNGSLGTISRIDNNNFIVDVDGKEARQVTFDITKYKDIDHGYAATIHKSQGVTVDRAYMLFNQYFDKSLSYVGMTRHKEKLMTYAPRNVFKNLESLIQTASRDGVKSMAIDFAARNGIDIDLERLYKAHYENIKQQACNNVISRKLSELFPGKTFSVAESLSTITGKVGKVFDIFGHGKMLEVVHDGKASTLIPYKEKMSMLKGKDVEFKMDDKSQAESCKFKAKIEEKNLIEQNNIKQQEASKSFDRDFF